MAETPPGPGSMPRAMAADRGRRQARPATTGQTDPMTASYPKGINETVAGGPGSGRKPKPGPGRGSPE